MLRPAYMPQSFRIPGLTADRGIPHAADEDFPTGMVFEFVDGEITWPSLGGLDDEIVQDDAAIAGITEEPYREAISGAGSLPVRQTDQGFDFIFANSPIELNWVADDDPSDPGNELSQDLVGQEVGLRVIGGEAAGLDAILVACPADGDNVDAVAVVVRLRDAIGTVYGRILVNILSANRLYS